MNPSPNRKLRLASLLLALASIAILSLCVGAKPIALSVVADSLFGAASHPDAVIVREGRLPRTLLGLLVGAALGAAGALIQALTRNPLADPGILGVNAGASFAVVLGIALLGGVTPGTQLWLAFGGALAASALVYLIGRHGAARPDPSRFVLAGVALGAVMMGLSSGLTLLQPAAFDRMRFWSAGSLDVRDLDAVLLVAPAILSGCGLALLLARPLNTLDLGDDLAIALGLHPRLIQGATLFAITLLCGAATAVAGPIAFVGLMVPHVARRLGGADQRWILPFTLTLAPMLLLLSDIVGRLLLPTELRVSIVTAFVGAPALIWLARRTAAGVAR